ncbi:MAG TPA: NCS2 family permease [Planctomycetes bacterium]|nr:NCS2 family permease [Planctomycetota bacterium]
MLQRVDAWFNVSGRGSTLAGEITGGVTTFVAMAYIIFVNPAILGDPAGAAMDRGAVMMATVLASGLASVLMGLLAGLPIALAPGMGMNALFSYTICAQMKVPWQTALGIVVISGVVFLMLSLVKFREMVIRAVPDGLKFAAACGIGLFIAFIGLKNAGIIVPDGATFVAFGPLWRPPVLLSLFALILTGVLVAFGVRGAILVGLVAAGLAGYAFGVVKPMEGFVPNLAAVALKADVRSALSFAFIVPILTFLFFDMFDTVGTLMGVSEAAGLRRQDGGIPNAGAALACDAAGTVAGGLLGTSTVTSYIESAAGVAAGARTGLAAVVTGVLFFLSIPLLRIVALFASPVPLEHTVVLGGAPHTVTLLLYPATSAALVIVGFQMARVFPKIAWDDVSEGLPAFLTIIVMPLTFSISDGLAAGFVSYVILKLVRGKVHQVHPLLYVISAAIVLGYIAGKI